MSDTTATGKCSLAKIHVPGQPSPDAHHLIPQSWQRFWRPANAKGELWAPTTVLVCPNHHRLIHEAIVRMMRTYTGEDAALAFKTAFGSMRTSPVRQTAYEALEGWIQVGGSLDALRGAKEWGEQ